MKKSLNDLSIIIIFCFNILVAFSLFFLILFFMSKNRQNKQENFNINIIPPSPSDSGRQGKPAQNSHEENYFPRDFYKGSQDKYVRIPFVPYEAHASDKTSGYCEIADFLIQWGTGNDIEFNFVTPFKECFGAFIIPYRNGGGKQSVGIKKIDHHKVEVITGSAERPYYWFAFGSKMKEKPK